jgi:ankyrin repeat protein
LLALTPGEEIALVRGRKTPLHYAAHQGNVEAIKLLVKLGAQLDARADSGETPLQMK